jgi:hypothetical protein
VFIEYKLHILAGMAAFRARPAKADNGLRPTRSKLINGRVFFTRTGSTSLENALVG